MHCYEIAIGQIVGRTVPDFDSFAELAEWLGRYGYALHLYHVPGIALRDIPIEGYAVVTQVLPDHSLHAVLTYCGIIDANNSGMGRQYAKADYPVTLITQLEPITNVTAQKN